MKKCIFLLLLLGLGPSSHTLVGAEQNQEQVSGKHKKRRRRRRRNAQDNPRTPSPGVQLELTESTESLPELSPVELIQKKIAALENTVYCALAPQVYETAEQVKQLIALLKQTDCQT